MSQSDSPNPSPGPPSPSPDSSHPEPSPPIPSRPQSPGKKASPRNDSDSLPSPSSRSRSQSPAPSVTARRLRASSASPSPAGYPTRTPLRSPTPSRSPTKSAGETGRSNAGESFDMDDLSEGSFSPAPLKRKRPSPSISASDKDESDSNKEDEIELQRKFAPRVPKLTRKASQNLALLKLPPVVQIHSRPFERSTFHPSDSAAILYRLREGVSEEDLVTAAMDNDKDVDEVTADLVESNSRIVTWSDGSQTLLIGTESYDFVTNDAHDVSQHVFSRHEDIQQALGIVEKRVRIQPSTISASRVRVTARVKTPVKRQMMLADVVKAPDVEEKIKARNAQKAAREQARLAARRRAVAQKNMTRARASGLSVSYMEDASDADVSSRYEREIELRKEKEAHRTSRLMNAKRGNGDSAGGVRVKRRRLGKHKIEDDDESERSDVSDDSEEE